MILSKLAFGRNCTSLLAYSFPAKRAVKNVFRWRAIVRRFCHENDPKRGRDYYKSESAESKRQSLKDRAMGPPGPNAFQLGKGAIAGGGIAALIALCYFGLGSKQDSTVEKSKGWPQYVHDRIHATYGYLGGSVIATAISALAVFNTPPLLYLFTRNGILYAIGLMVAMVGSGYLAQSIEYKKGFGIKQMAWLAHCAIMGGVLAPMCFFGGPIMIRASMYTAGVVGGLSAIAVCAPSDKFLFTGGVLAIGLGLLIAASLASIWLPPTTAIGAGLSSFVVYGGLLIFGGFLLFDTQRIIYLAEHFPKDNDVQRYDPIEAAISIYMDILNIFIRMVLIMGANDSGKR